MVKNGRVSSPKVPLRACIKFASTLSPVGFCRHPSEPTPGSSMNIYRRIRDWQRIPECLFWQGLPCHSTKASPRIPEGSGQPLSKISLLKPLPLGRGVIDIYVLQTKCSYVFLTNIFTRLKSNNIFIDVEK